MTQFLITAFLLLSGLIQPFPIHAAEPATTPSPPAWIKPAFDRGLTKVEFYDPAKPPRFPGWTDFEFELTYQFDYRYQLKKDPKKKYLVTVTPQFSKVEFQVKHRVQLPPRLDTPQIWQDSLALHELDHVAIGAHRRVELLALQLIRQIRRIEATVDNPGQITEDWVNKLVRDAIAPRREALDELIKANNRRLDKLTGHGAQELEQRDSFFGEMYLKENLDDVKFPYLSEAIELMQDRDYQSARWEAPTHKTDRSEK